MNAAMHVLTIDIGGSLGEVLDLLEQANGRLTGYAKDNRDLSWNVVMAADLVNQARQYTSRAIKEASCE